MRILGIDPGIDRVGWAVIDHDNSRDIWVGSGCIVTDRGEDSAQRLHHIADQLRHLISNFRPEALGVEKLFFSKNSKTAMIVGEARGVILATAAAQGLAITEITPNEVKLSITGNGNATKEQVLNMVIHWITLPPKKRLDDEIDAIAVALTTARRV